MVNSSECLPTCYVKLHVIAIVVTLFFTLAGDSVLLDLLHFKSLAYILFTIELFAGYVLFCPCELSRSQSRSVKLCGQRLVTEGGASGQLILRARSPVAVGFRHDHDNATALRATVVGGIA